MQPMRRIGLVAGVGGLKEYRGKGRMELISRCWDITGYCFLLYMSGNTPLVIHIYHHRIYLFTQPTGLSFIMKNAYF